MDSWGNHTLIFFVQKAVAHPATSPGKSSSFCYPFSRITALSKYFVMQFENSSNRKLVILQ
jgi:hypothetical protein